MFEIESNLPNDIWNVNMIYGDSRACGAIVLGNNSITQEEQKKSSNTFHWMPEQFLWDA